jgi:hypothetical protein
MYRELKLRAALIREKQLVLLADEIISRKVITEC